MSGWFEIVEIVALVLILYLLFRITANLDKIRKK